MGLFHAWTISTSTYSHWSIRVPPLLNLYLYQYLQMAQANSQLSGDDDFAGLRNYVAGDALPRIAWKALAREQGLQVKQFSTPMGQDLWLDWAAIGEQGMEAKLEVLTRWVLDADAQGMRYGLRLPDGDGHRNIAQLIKPNAYAAWPYMV